MFKGWWPDQKFKITMEHKHKISYMGKIRTYGKQSIAYSLIPLKSCQNEKN